MATIIMLTAVSILLHMAESMISVSVPILGFELSLANIVGLIAYYLFDAGAMLPVNTIRVVLASLLKGIPFGTGFWLSIYSVLLPTLACILTRKTPMSIYGASVIGNSAHAIGQIVAVTLIYQQFFIQAILSVLILLDIPTGLFVAHVARVVLKRVHIG